MSLTIPITSLANTHSTFLSCTLAVANAITRFRSTSNPLFASHQSPPHLLPRERSHSPRSFAVILAGWVSVKYMNAKKSPLGRKGSQGDVLNHDCMLERGPLLLSTLPIHHHHFRSTNSYFIIDSIQFFFQSASCFQEAGGMVCLTIQIIQKDIVMNVLLIFSMLWNQNDPQLQKKRCIVTLPNAERQMKTKTIRPKSNLRIRSRQKEKEGEPSCGWLG